MIVVDKVLEELVTQGVNALVQTVTDNVKLIRGIDSEIIDLTSDIETFNARLGEAFKNPRANDHNVLRVIVKKFRFVVDEAKDTIANYVVLNKRHGDHVFSKSWDRIPLCGKVSAYASDIKSIRAKMKAIRQEHERELLYLMQFEIKGQDNNVKTLQARPTAEKNKVFGFENDLEAVRIHLLEASNSFVVIPIVGMTGTGKTTFAFKLFEDSSIHSNSIRIWVPVSKRCDRKQKFISIIYQITKSTEDLTNKTEEMLKDTIRNLLKDQVYFIILDDVWEKTDWDSLQAAFPNNMNGSKILVTTRHDNVVDSTWKPHHLEKLSDDDGWKLIKNNVFGIEGCSDKEFEKHGKQIAKKCNGLPLALVVVAGILGKCITSKDWERVANNPLLEINREDQSYHELVKLSYDDLPHEKLKNCFLYFAYFPMGHEIAIWKLIRLWIAEEFIPTVNEWGYPLGDVEVEAQKYLNDLVDRNLVMVIRRRADGQIKTCRIHDTLHEFCKSEAARKELFHIMDEGQKLDENTCSTRRLGFHAFTGDIFDDDAENKSSAGLFINCYNQRRSLYPFGKHIHSLLLSSTQKSETRFAQEKLATIPNNFPLLRVLNIESINCDCLPIEVFGLYLLKYLAITSNLNLLPESFKNLRELETLVIKTTARTLEIEGGIWNMEKLRHVRTNTSAQLPFPPKIKSGGKTIRTLSTISPTSCTKETFSRTPNLQKLGVRGNLSQLLEEKKNICLLNNIGMLKCLENLKLYGQYDKVLTVPVLDKFACKLKKLSFSGTLFEWKDMAVLGKLEELEVLKLDDYAFKGENWELSNDVVFRRLQYLGIGRTNLVTWKLATHNSFPALQGLVLRNCSSIERIPENFAKVHTLKVMELFHMSENAVKSANEIKENVDRRIKLVITFEKREGPMTAAMDMVIKQEVSEAVDRVVQTVAAYNKNYNVKQSWGAPRVVLDSEIQDLTSDIETFNARLVEAYKNPFACVDVLIVKNFQTVVNKAEDAVANYIALKKKMYEEDKALRTLTFPLPINIKKLKSCESEIQSVKTQVDMIRQQHENELQSLNKYKTGVLPSLQREGVTVFDKVIEDIKVVVNKLVQIVEENVNLVCYVESVHAEINDMTSHIQTFKEKLVEACKNPNANEHRVLRVVVKKFRMLVNEAEDVVANYFSLEKKHGGKHLLQKLQLENIAFYAKARVYAVKIQSLSAKMKRIGKHHDKDLLYLLDYKHIDLPSPKVGPVHENKIVGFKNDLETVKDRLMEASNNLIVIPIVGMGGIGKTTLALKFFEDPEIIQKFTHCIWVHVSHCFDRRQTFIKILYQITKHAEDFSIHSEDVLGDKIKNLLEAKRYFIVLDDVWEKEVWDSLKVACPENLNGSRVLVTTRSHDLVDPTWKSHKLGLLSDDEGWLIIKQIVFGEMDCSDPLLEDIGRRIAKQCRGLPLSLVMIAGILRTCTTIDDWQQIDKKLFSGIDQQFHEVIGLSYKHLPHEMLKNCFLYFANFPEGHEIAVWKLIRLWIAEEFILTIDEFGYPLDVEVEAQKYLNDLVDRNLVTVRKRRADGQIKICCIHDLLHDFCKSEATKKNLFKVIDDEGQKLDDENTSSSSSTPRRLCFHSSTMDILLGAEKNPSRLYLSSYNKRRRRSPFGKQVHSLSAFSSEWGEIIDVTQEQLATISNTFALLKVLNIEQQLIRSSLLPNDIYGLYLLRYLAITANNLNFLPKSFKNLGELETLVINTTEPRLQIDGGIWNMEKLRHVHTNTPMQLPSPPKNSSGGTSIHTLCTISPASCTKDIFRKIPNLQKLGIRGNLSELGLLQQQDQKVCLFNNLLQMLYWLENLKLHGNSEKVALKVPMLDMFASKLRKLTLCGTLFQWNDMAVLGSLETLEVLKLDSNAFFGELWNLSPDVTFKRLKYLRIGRTNLVTWTAEGESFPVLESLVLRNCISLQNIPYAFADVPSLKVMELFHVHERVANSAKEIHDDILNYGGEVNLLITPLPPQATEVHEQEYGEENVNTIGSDIPSTSNPKQEIVHV